MNNGTVVKDPKEETATNKSIQTIGKGYLERKMTKQKEKTIRATITVEVPYSNELLNDGSKLNKKLKQVIADTDYLPHETQAGELAPSKRPVIK